MRKGDWAANPKALRRFRYRLGEDGELRAPKPARSDDELPRADALYRVIGQRALGNAPIAYARAVVGEVEVKVDKAELSPDRRQVGGIGGEYVQEEPRVRIAVSARFIKVCQDIIAQV